MPVQYTNWYPNPWYGDARQPGGSVAPVVYMPTDTTQLGAYYQTVPSWEPRPWMLPADPTPSAYVMRERGFDVEPIVYKGSPLEWHCRHKHVHWHGGCPPQGVGHGPVGTPCGPGYSYPYSTVRGQVRGLKQYYDDCHRCSNGNGCTDGCESGDCEDGCCDGCTDGADAAPMELEPEMDDAPPAPEKDDAPPAPPAPTTTQTKKKSFLKRVAFWRD